MKLLLIFLSFWLGLLFRQNLVFHLVLFFIFLIYVFKRFTIRKTIVCLVVFVTGFIYSNLRVNQNSSEYKGIVYQARDNYFLFNSNGERFYVSNYNNTYDVGEVLSIKGMKVELDFEVLESGFNFNSYLNERGIFHQLKTKKIIVNYNSIFRLNSYKDFVLQKLDENARTLMSAILFSDHNESEISDALDSLHLARLMSNSGLYLYFIIKCVEFLLKFFLKEKKAKLLSIIILTFYSLLTFPRFTVIRILTLLILRWVNKYCLQKKYKDISLISFTGIVFLILNPYLAIQDSFTLGYIFPLFFFISGSFLKKFEGFKGKIITALCLYLLFLPFELKYYNSLVIVSPFYTLLLSPIFLPFSLLCFISLTGFNLSGTLNPYVSFLNGIINFLKPIAFEINAPAFNEWVSLIYYVIFIVILYYLSIGFKPFYKPIFTIFFTMIIIHVIPIENQFTSSVSFINVGQGDSCLIRYKNYAVLIDTGGSIYKDIAQECLIPYLKKNRIYDIDLLITTHDDFDHNGAASSLINNFKVKKYITEKEDFPYKVGPILLSNLNQLDYDNDNDNDNSLVIYFKMWNMNYLIMGDASKAVENKIMEKYSNVPCDILKIGHHGSDTSTSKKFVSFVNPIEAIVSVGDNKYGHPHKSVLDILKEANIKIRRTDIEGTITYKNYNFM